jgi:hypothetical protein
MKRHFCTITTKSHLGKTFALCNSILKFNQNASIHVLLIDKNKSEINSSIHFESQVFIYDSFDLNKNALFKEAIRKYKNYPDKLRWTLKPIFLLWLFSHQKDFSKIIYTDNDIFFTGDYEFLFKELDEHNILLTPHWRADDPFNFPWWFETNFRDGIFNAGFIGVNNNAIHALEWWAKARLYKCRKSYLQGLFDDQKYLDLMPVIEHKTGIIHHKGCNVAGWNIITCPRRISDGIVLIDNKFPPIFVHFADCTLAAIATGKDIALEGIYSEYLNTLKLYNYNISIEKVISKEVFLGRYRQLKWLLTGGIFIIKSDYYNRLKSFFTTEKDKR